MLLAATFCKIITFTKTLHILLPANIIIVNCAEILYGQGLDNLLTARFGKNRLALETFVVVGL